MLDRLIVFLVPLSIMGFFVRILIDPQSIYLLGLILLLIFFSLAKFYSWKFKNKNFWYFLITPILFCISSVLFFCFLEINLFLKYFLIILFTSFQWLIYKNIFFVLKMIQKYQPNTIRNIFNFVNLISIFFFAVGFFALIVLVRVPAWPMAIILFLVSVLYFFQFFWINKIQEKKAWFSAIISAIIFVEMFFVISFLPTSFYVDALILALIYFNIKNLGKKHLLNNLIVKRDAIKYLIIDFFVLIFILTTAQYH